MLHLHIAGERDTLVGSRSGGGRLPGSVVGLLKVAVS